jgi:hypothetical protein
MDNIFVLCTGRCGSTTLISAAQHIRNFTAGHETRAQMVGKARFDYGDNHIEADNRMSWMLGRLDQVYGARAKYVHLMRDPVQTARSFDKRWNVPIGIISAYRNGILKGSDAEPSAVCVDYVETVTANIRSFLKDKPNWIEFRLENAQEDWRRFWEWSGAEGDFDASLAEWSTRHNATVTRPLVARAAGKLRSVTRSIFK